MNGGDFYIFKAMQYGEKKKFIAKFIGYCGEYIVIETESCGICNRFCLDRSDVKYVKPATFVNKFLLKIKLLCN